MTDPYTPNPQDVTTGKAYAVIAYLSILVLIPLLTAKDNRFVRFHTNQGLLLLIVSVAASFISRLPFVGWVGGLVGVATFVLMILGIINAANGQCKPLPIIGQITLLNV